MAEPVLVSEEGVCRICGDPAWSRDEAGHVHVCCARHGSAPCPACVTSKALRRPPRPLSEPSVDAPPKAPREGFRFTCERCGRHSGLYTTQETCDEDQAAHDAHRCPGPWLLESNDTREYVSLLPERPTPRWMRKRDRER